MPDLLLDLADAARKSGLIVIEIDGWESNYSGGAFRPDGSLDHHTGSYDGLTDAENDLDYAYWLAFTGRPADGVPPPLCNLALSAECVVYVCSAGNANHAGQARRSGPMPAASDGNAIYIGTEAMNSGSQGWESEGVDAAGNPLTQGEALARLDAALAVHYGWPASHVRGHKETSVTDKWDPGLLDMDRHRRRVAHYIKQHQEDDMFTDEDRALLKEINRRTKRSGERERRTIDLLRKLRPLVKDAATVEEIDALLDERS